MSDTQAVQQFAYMVRVFFAYYVPWWVLLVVFLGLMALFWKYQIAIAPDSQDDEDE